MTWALCLSHARAKPRWQGIESARDAWPRPALDQRTHLLLTEADCGVSAYGETGIVYSLAQNRYLFQLGVSLMLLGSACIGHASARELASPQAEHSQDVANQETFEHAVAAQHAAVGKENSTTPSAAWAGDYYFGDGLGQNVHLSVSPRSGIAATWRGCLGTYAANKGKVVPQADGSLLLKYEQPNDPKGIGFADHVIPVPWGDRMYMISEGELPAFASAVNLGDEPREGQSGSFFLRQGDESRKVHGPPVLPPRQQSLIREVPLEVGVVSANRLPKTNADTFECRFRLKLDRGANDGLASGMNLVAIRIGAGSRLALEQTTPTRAVGTMSLFGDECAKPDQWPSTKTRFTTGAYRATKKEP